MRKLLSLLMAVALAGVFASSASAAVEVRNGSGELCGVEASCAGLEFRTVPGGTLNFVNPSYGWSVHSCAFETTVDVSSSGELSVWPVELSGPYCSYGVTAPDDCDDAGFGGQIVGPGDEGYTGAGDFEAVLVTCWDSAFSSSWSLGEMHFGIDAAGSGSDWTFADQPAFLSGSIELRATADFGGTLEGLQVNEVEG